MRRLRSIRTGRSSSRSRRSRRFRSYLRRARCLRPLAPAPPLQNSALATTVGFLVLILVGSCITSPAAPPPGRSPLRAPVEYSGLLTLLFDNEFESGVLGYRANEIVPTRPDRTLRERIEDSDSVVRARIATVTASCDDSGCGWQLDLEVLQTLAGAARRGDRIVLRVGPTDPSASLLRRLDTQLVERTVVFFLRTFLGTDREDRVCFHASPDRPDELAAVRTATLLNEAR